MKKMKYYSLIVWLLALVMMVSCEDVSVPVQATAFIDQYFPESSVVLVEIENDEGTREYSVWLNDGTKIEFDVQGNWKRVGRKKTGVPSMLIPDTIMQYVKTHYPNNVVTKFSKKEYGYKLELSDDMDLRFNKQFQFIGEID
jgi:hypothetical protein